MEKLIMEQSQSSESTKTELSEKFLILIVCGEHKTDKYYDKHIEIIKKYCQNSNINRCNVTFENLNKGDEYLSISNIYNEYKLIPRGEFESMYDYECERNHVNDEIIEDNKKFNDDHNNKYDYIIFEHCPIPYFQIEYFKYHNMLKLHGYLIIFCEIFFFDSNNIVTPCFNDNTIVNRENESQNDRDKCELYDDGRICDSSVCLQEIYNLQFLNGCGKIFSRINKYMFKKENENIYNMKSIIQKYFEYIFNFNPNNESEYKSGSESESESKKNHNKYLKYKYKYKQVINHK